MKKSWEVLIAMLALTYLLLAPAIVMAAQKSGFLNNLDGSWKGKGIVMRKPGAKKEIMRCRLKNTKKNDELILKGNCSFGVTLIPMTGWIRQSRRNNYEASLFKGLLFLDMNSSFGKLKKNKLKFKFKGKNKSNNEIVRIHITIYSTNKGRFNIIISKFDAKTGNPFKMGDVTFLHN